MFFNTCGSFSFSGISSSSSQVSRVLACIDILPLLGAGNLPDCLFMVSNINIEPPALVLDVTEDDL